MSIKDAYADDRYRKNAHSANYWLDQSEALYQKNEAARNAGKNKDNGGNNYGYYMSGVRAFTPSAEYQQEMVHANNILNALKSGRTAYTDQLNNIMNQIQNRGKFSYDMDTDSMFQNSLASAQRTGKAAMQDTMGQAAALTGGYGSTYATSAANQAYNAYIQDAYNNLPDYYNMALEAYNQETQNMYNQASMLQSADESWYNRIANAYQAQLDKVNTLYNNEYNNYWQAQQMNQSAAQFNANMKYQQDKDYQSYLSSLASSAAKASGSSSEEVAKTASDYEKQIKAAAEKYGTYQATKKNGLQWQNDSEFYQWAADFANTYGLDVADVVNIGLTNTPSSVYKLNKDGHYVDQWGTDAQMDEITDPNDPNYGGYTYALPQFTMVKSQTNKKKSDNDVFEDQFGNQYTRIQIQSMYGGKFAGLI